MAKVRTEEAPESIAELLQGIERTCKKAPPFRFGPRTLDLDLLLWDDQIFPGREEWLRSNQQAAGSEQYERCCLLSADPSDPAIGRAGRCPLLVPHPRMHERRFVLAPLAELIDTQSLHPVWKQSWSALLEKSLDQSCDREEMTL